MTQRDRRDDRSRATEPDFYIPAGTTGSSVASRIERFWATLFNHGISSST